jgi:hypothetical protein
MEQDGSMTLIGSDENCLAFFDQLVGQGFFMGIPQSLLSMGFVGGVDDVIDYIALGFGFSENVMTLAYYYENFQTTSVWRKFCIRCAIAQLRSLITPIF